MVKTWLISSMTTEVSEDFLLQDTAAEIWNDVQLTYSNSDNSSEVFEIESMLHNLPRR